ncbi:uncharacterized protein NECHADRAFT_83196 [Fusarium vanettenii 77-13-4]|uniref:Uncharacterized protein n=1 Tax=Fusarium vanettenii (strain ATCC MYA-4622 / CBS 123669 / FGSC 9596 / NRRL 45880 / 77-13-4) TaxID=660122 RepID=C7ZB39_FUSV7|nr:uncharacterized protein NECHADRAFT_83196 [Fusarium vanettenii 77-13-4]EEU38865.1 hypothetical protein NECHADRAFT_83196 [Fusarium vanettenii 77-13-4]
MKEQARELGLIQTSQHDQDLSSIKVENCVGFTKVPLSLAGPLRIVGRGVDRRLYPPLVIYEAMLVASCPRGCKAFDSSGGVQVHVFEDGLSRGPVFIFKDPGAAIASHKAAPTLQDEFAGWSTSMGCFLKLKKLNPYPYGDAAGQNMTTKATSYARDML